MIKSLHAGEFKCKFLGYKGKKYYNGYDVFTNSWDIKFPNKNRVTQFSPDTNEDEKKHTHT